MEPLGLQAEAESGPRRLEAEVRDTPAPATLEDGRPAGDPLLSHSALRWLTDRGGKWLSIIGGLGLMLRTTGRWWAGLWVRSGSGEIIHGADGEWRSWDQLTIRHDGETGSQNTFGAKTQQNSPGLQHYSPLTEGASSHRGTTERGGNGWEPRWRLRRRTNTREGTG